MQDHHVQKKNVGLGIALVSLVCLLQPAANAQSSAETPEAVRACQRVAGSSSRLACYDRAFPPVLDSVDGGDTSTLREERVATVAEPEPPLATTVRIVEVQMPSLDTTRFVAADGRIFVRERARTVVRWPDTPFDVEIQSGIFGTIYLKFPDSGRRIRVSVLD
jgi:hypothetical protein